MEKLECCVWTVAVNNDIVSTYNPRKNCSKHKTIFYWWITAEGVHRGAWADVYWEWIVVMFQVAVVVGSLCAKHWAGAETSCICSVEVKMTFAESFCFLVTPNDSVQVEWLLLDQVTAH